MRAVQDRKLQSDPAHTAHTLFTGQSGPAKGGGGRREYKEYIGTMR